MIADTDFWTLRLKSLTSELWTRVNITSNDTAWFLWNPSVIHQYDFDLKKRNAIFLFSVNKDMTEKHFLLNQQALMSAGERNSETSAWRRLGISLQQQQTREKASGGPVPC